MGLVFVLFLIGFPLVLTVLALLRIRSTRPL